MSTSGRQTGVPTLWRATETFPAGADLLMRVVTYIDPASIVRLLQVEKQSRRRVQQIFTTFQRARGRLALASLCFSRLRVEFQSYYQELETQNIPRSNDPRVPPRVVSIWEERGQVAGGSVSLEPVELPNVHKDGVTAHFVADVNAAGKRPMLTNVVQRNRRIYTMITVKFRTVSGDGVVLRNYSYLKEFGEWKTPTMPEKRMLASASTGSRRGRFDLISQDGSVVLELEVPTGTDAQTDYFLVKQSTVAIHLQELLQLHFHSLRPIRALPEPTRHERCSISVSFRSMKGNILSACCVPGYITVERQDREAPPENTITGDQDRRRQRSAVENFEIVICRADCNSEQPTMVALPNDPGYAWFEVRGTDEASRRSSIFFYATALHYGARRVPERGDLRALQFYWLPGTLETFPTLESRRRRCLKGNVRMVCSSFDNTQQELTIVAQRLPAARLDRYAAQIDSYTRHET